MSRMDNTTQPVIPAITPLEDRAIRRFEHDNEFHSRVHAEAQRRRELTTDLEINIALQDAMRELQSQDEAKHSDEAIVRGAFYLGNELLGIPYAIASIPEQEALKAGVRRLLAAVEGRA